MSQLLVDDIINRSEGAPEFSKGAVVTGVCTASSGVDISAGGLNVTAGVSTFAGIGTFGGNVFIDGDVTAGGIDVTAGGVNVVGCGTYTTGVDLQGFKVEEFKNETSTGLNGEFDFLLEDGHLQRFTTATAGNYFPDFKVSSTVSLDSIMDVGDAITTTLIVASSSHYCVNTLKVDNVATGITTSWIGGSAPAAANGSGYDIYSFTIMKTAATPTWHIIGNTLGAA